MHIINSAQPRDLCYKTVLYLAPLSCGLLMVCAYFSTEQLVLLYLEELGGSGSTIKILPSYRIYMCVHSTFLRTTWHFLFISHMVFRHRHSSCSLALCSGLQMSLFTCNGSWSDYRKETGQSSSASSTRADRHKLLTLRRPPKQIKHKRQLCKTMH